jgi:8-oxo-dGTP pyrophosphatase MutT (NUDIX family)
MVLPRFASTVVLVRAGNHGAGEVLLTRRPEGMRFLGGFYVFPGGTVNASDYAAETLERCRGLSAEQAKGILQAELMPSQALGHWVAAAREAFEEVGVLLCCPERAPSTATEQAKTRFERARRGIVSKELGFGAFLQQEKLFCDLSRIVYFDHWITPAIYSIRFDTRFYIAALPPHQQALTRSEEVTHSLWIEPQEALARIDQHDFPILPPTTIVLQRLARLSTWERLRAHFKLP